ncbi:hypothetical protein OO013_00005, partial [Mangrovivirga sp. M17]|nr:hypothetical protein [Mangrovivirga halotolerans]
MKSLNVIFNNNRNKTQNSFLQLFLYVVLFLSTFSVFSQVTVTPATGGTNICGDGSFIPLSNIIVTETTNSDFSAGTYDIDLVLPAGFEFNTATGTITVSNGNKITINTAAYITTSTARINITVSSATGGPADELTYSGLEVRLTGAATSGNITFSDPGTNVFGLNGTNAGNLNFKNVEGIISGTTSICPGTSTLLTFNLTGGAAPYDVVYSDGTTNYTVNNITDGSTVSVSPSTTTTYSLVSVTDDAGCIDQDPAGSATITIESPVSGLLSAEPSAICAGESVDLSFTLSGSSTTYDVTYTDGTTPVTLTGISNGHVETITPTATATYSLTSITANASGCTTTSNLSGTPTVTVNPLPDGSLSGGATVCVGGSTNLTFNFTAGTAPFDVVYTDGTTNFTANNITDGATVSVSPSTTTTYTLVSVTDDNGCSDPTPTGSATVTVSPQVSG